MSSFKVSTAVLSGEFETNGIIYVVEQITDEISRVTKKGSASFNLLGKVVLNDDAGEISLIVHTDIDSAFVIKNVKSIYVSTRGILEHNQLNDLPRLIIEAEGKVSAIAAPPVNELPSVPIISQAPLIDIEKASFKTGDIYDGRSFGFIVKPNKDGPGMIIRERMPWNIVDCKDNDIYHHVARSTLIEYEDGTKNVVGFNELGRPVFISKEIMEVHEIIPKQLNGAPVKELGTP